MDVKSIKQIAEEQNVSYEAIRKQIVRYRDDLKDHIIRKNRAQYLDGWAVDFLKEKRKENPIILMKMDQTEEIEELRVQVDILKNKLLSAQEQIIFLENEMKKEIETQIRYTVLLEDNQKKDEKLKKLECENKRIELELSHILEKQEENQRTIELIRRKNEKYRKTIKELSREKEKAQAEAQLFTRSIFGIYRKKIKGKGRAKMLKRNK